MSVARETKKFENPISLSINFVKRLFMAAIFSAARWRAYLICAETQQLSAAKMP
jgi:hypothetical protein